mmetsp:Transcript_165867/g.532548  ORF Transcript_165867/g.532548 Transcript_165867/m.532548 type:complete len:80 (-) Transcript_165867:27-266(-)
MPARWHCEKYWACGCTCTVAWTGLQKALEAASRAVNAKTLSTEWGCGDLGAVEVSILWGRDCALPLQALMISAIHDQLM